MFSSSGDMFATPEFRSLFVSLHRFILSDNNTKKPSQKKKTAAETNNNNSAENTLNKKHDQKQHEFTLSFISALNNLFNFSDDCPRVFTKDEIRLVLTNIAQDVHSGQAVSDWLSCVSTMISSSRDGLKMFSNNEEVCAALSLVGAHIGSSSQGSVHNWLNIVNTLLAVNETTAKMIITRDGIRSALIKKTKGSLNGTSLISFCSIVKKIAEFQECKYAHSYFGYDDVFALNFVDAISDHSSVKGRAASKNKKTIETAAGVMAISDEDQDDDDDDENDLMIKDQDENENEEQQYYANEQEAELARVKKEEARAKKELLKIMKKQAKNTGAQELQRPPRFQGKEPACIPNEAHHLWTTALMTILENSTSAQKYFGQYVNFMKICFVEAISANTITSPSAADGWLKVIRFVISSSTMAVSSSSSSSNNKKEETVKNPKKKEKETGGAMNNNNLKISSEKLTSNTKPVNHRETFGDDKTMKALVSLVGVSGQNNDSASLWLETVASIVHYDEDDHVDEEEEKESYRKTSHHQETHQQHPPKQRFLSYKPMLAAITKLLNQVDQASATFKTSKIGTVSRSENSFTSSKSNYLKQLVIDARSCYQDVINREGPDAFDSKKLNEEKRQEHQAKTKSDLERERMINELLRQEQQLLGAAAVTDKDTSTTTMSMMDQHQNENEGAVDDGECV